jgi:hypothetical protein
MRDLEMEIKGTAVLAIQDFVKVNYKERYEDWIDALPIESKHIFTEVINSSKWYPLREGAIIPTKRIGELFYSRNYNEAALDSGKYSAQKALTGIYYFFVKASSTAHVIKRAPKIFNTYYRPGEIVVVKQIENEITLQIRNMTESHDIIEHRIAGWMHKAMEISGARTIRIHFTKSMAKGDPITQLDIHWT